MSEANLEIVRRGIEAAFRRPKPDFATINGLYHPDHELISRLDALEGGSHRGARGYREWMLSLEETMQSESSLQKVMEIDDDRVLAVTTVTHQGKSSGVALPEERLASIVTVRDGKIIRTEVYPSREEALKAVGLAG